MMGDGAAPDQPRDVSYEYDSRTEAPSEVVVRAVASTTNQSMLSLDPLYHAIEPDALDAFVDPDGRGSACWLTFSYEGCRVYVDEDTVGVTNLELDVAE